MEEKLDLIEFTSEDGDTVLFSVIGQVKITGIDYLLVTDSDGDDDGEADVLVVKGDADDVVGQQDPVDCRGIGQLPGCDAHRPVCHFTVLLLCWCRVPGPAPSGGC